MRTASLAFILGYMSKESSLQSLQQLKEESDRGNYSEKQRIFRLLYANDPKSFIVDSKQDNVYGLTHMPTGFRFHLPGNVVPEALRKVQEGKQDAE